METAQITNILRQSFVERCQRNESYSLRAFAKSLDVDHSLLAKIIRGDRKLSKKMAFKVGEKLGISLTQIKELIEAQAGEVNSELIQEDALCVMSDWFHFAILELIKIDIKALSPQKISNLLSITKLEARLATERLERLGFIETIKGDLVLSRSNNNWFNFNVTNNSRKFLQKQLLEKAKIAVDEVSFERRVNSSLTIAIDSAELKEYQKLTQELIKKCDERSEKTIKKNEVYQLSVAIFPLTNRSVE